MKSIIHFITIFFENILVVQIFDEIKLEFH